MLAAAFDDQWLKNGTLVPVPPSKSKNHPQYDDRMLKVCNIVKAKKGADVRELVLQTADTEAFHESQNNRLSVDELLEIYKINEEKVEPEPTSIMIVDDVLTAGTHFRAMHSILAERFPKADIHGAFIARWKRIESDPAADFGIILDDSQI